MDRLPSKLPFSKKKLPARVMVSALIIGFTLLDAIEPYHQHFSLKNYTLQYPYAVKERVPVPLAAFLCVGCPAAIITFYTLVVDGWFSHKKSDEPIGSRRGRFRGPYKLKERLWELNCGVLGLLLSTAAAVTITGALKNATGKPRPDLIDRCRPKEGSVDPPVFGLVTSEICTQQNNAILKDGFRSFPSGHSSTAFAGLFYLSLYLAGKLHVLDNRGEVWKTFIVLIPTLGAALIADSRIMDARHHPFDVLSGSFLGIVVAWCSYRQYFPSISEFWKKGRAYPIRTWGRPPLHPKDREEGLEPLREPKTVFPDEEAGMAGYSSGAGGSPALRTDDSQGLRQQEFRARPSGSQPYGQNTSPPLPQPPPPPKHSTPLISRRESGRRIRHDDDYMSSSSSSDHGEDYELEQTYSLTNPNNQPPVQNFSALDDTSYHPPTQMTQLQAKTASPRLLPQRKPVSHAEEDGDKKGEENKPAGSLEGVAPN
ncbi:hypothetical protein GP486_003428 [Trichoglossum hirsutum]|uniref:Phosphatidic acid phosphatase type 2/haloperoxidase domain-containing protein n=1 Tax=Trichoglossum hirsutum TaxID=265104 RepID=A0A9P8LD30_9PEZI|nr:hypothetical protein GP486_003428 [Trichoglossum hirsutum]